MVARRLLSLAVFLASAIPLSVTAVADEREILTNIRQFLETTNAAKRTELVERIQADPAYDRKQVNRWLHQAAPFKALKPGPHAITVPLRNGSTRRVSLRIPANYDHERPWPLIYALHGTGGHGTDMIRYLEQVLGEAVEQYIIAAPNEYGEPIIHHTYWPPVGEHPAVLLKVKQTVHVDSDRVTVMGYSLGAHTTWTLAMLHADQFAGAMPLAGTFTLMLPDLMWESFLPNAKQLPILCVWGDGDVHYGGERISPQGGIAGVNRALRKLLAAHEVPATMIELPKTGHRGVVPPANAVKTLFAHKRVHSPAKIEHMFRHVYQARAYWLEGHVWTGKQWTDKQATVRFRSGETPLSDEDFDNAAARTYRGLLGRLSGEIDGQRIRISRRRVKELTVWIHDGMIDWSQPVTLIAGGREAFNDPLEPSLYVCLSQAARTYDFDCLRWAGLRVRSGAKPRRVTPDTVFPTWPPPAK